jgi:L-fuculose-phosphate aldolase
MTSSAANDERKVRIDVVDTARSLLARGFVVGTEGNVSARLDASERFLITPSNTAYESLKPEDLALCSLGCEHLAGEMRPSIELPLHAAVYCARPDVSAIIHTHSPHATSVAFSGEAVPLRAKHFRDAIGSDTIPCAAYAPQGSTELAENVVAVLVSKTKGLLLADHGALAVGSSLEEAFAISEMIEEACVQYLRSRLTGPGPGKNNPFA